MYLVYNSKQNIFVKEYTASGTQQGVGEGRVEGSEEPYELLQLFCFYI